ncbi:MAG: sigma-70 family RNA polymerase sigma factor [Clostridia bacterium]|nr:sigma-70 family RNA polymerase sigma factor [Clostridia bacterium]
MSNKPQEDRDAIVERYADMVWRIALSRTRREDAAEEVFQEVFLRLFQKERSFNEEEHRKAWLIRATLVCCRSYLTASFRNATLSLEEVGDCIALPEEKSVLFEAMLRLPAKYRIPIQLYYIEGMDSDEGAKAMGIRSGTFRVRLSRGRNMLRELLKGEGINV